MQSGFTPFVARDFRLSVFLTEHRKGAEGDACHQLLAVKNSCKAGKGSLQLNTAPQRDIGFICPLNGDKDLGGEMGMKGEEERAPQTLEKPDPRVGTGNCCSV